MRLLVAAGFAAMVLISGPAAAQNLFAPRLYVNNEVITDYEVRQRALFLQLLNAAGDPETEALKQLTDERLQQGEAARLKVEVPEADIREGMERFASQAELSADQLIAELKTMGVDPETFRDFVTANLLWRDVVRERFGGRVPISDVEISRKMESLTEAHGLKAQIAELVIPIQSDGDEQAVMAQARQLSREIHTQAEFSAAARRYSAAATAESGGQIPGWLSLSDLPPRIATAVAGLGEGEVSAPMMVPNAVVLFQLRGLAPDEKSASVASAVEWAEFAVAAPDLASVVTAVRNRADSCDDLYTVAKGQPIARLTRHDQDLAMIPEDVRLELSRLDQGNISIGPNRNGFHRVLMLCQRRPAGENAPSHDQVLDMVVNEKLDGLAKNYMEKLRAAALIREP